MYTLNWCTKHTFSREMSNNFPIIRKLAFSRGMYFGTCPVYDVNVFEDGRVEWLGEHFVEVTGPAL